MTLQKMHEGVDRVKEVRLQNLHTEFENLQMGETQSVDEFAGKLTSLYNQIVSLGGKMEESVAVKKYLRVLPEKFVPVVTTLMYSSNLETKKIEEIRGSLKAHEELLKGYQSRNEKRYQTHNEQALLLKGDTRSERGHWRGRGGRGGRGDGAGQGGGDRSRDKSHVKCYKCEEFGHYASECRSHIKCFNCDKYVHYALDCRNKKKNEEVNLTQTSEGDKPTLLFSLCDKEAPVMMMLNEENVVSKLRTNGGSRDHTDEWYLDNGASNHMTGDRSIFHELDEKISGKVKFGDGSTVEIRGKGLMLLQ